MSTLKEIIQFCKERDLNYYLVIPPVIKYLSNYFSETFKDNYIYSFIKEVGVEEERVLDYLTDKELQNIEYYFNSFFLNKKGRKLFTKKTLKDIKII